MAKVYYRDEWVNEVVRMIQRKAIDVVLTPQMKILAGQTEQSIESLERLNDRIAQYNAGVQAMTRALMHELEKDPEDEKDE